MDHTQTYDLKNLRLDSSHSVIEVGNGSYRAITMMFARHLKGTRL
ncbi:hypothetical protein [Rufibacter hautae]|nr:hypothetical protein [Rufibacter hautae]